MIKTTSTIQTLALLLSLLLVISGCATVSQKSVAIKGAVANQQRGLASLNEDQTIRHQANTMLVRDPAFKNSHLVAGTFNHDILLIGETPEPSLRTLAEKKVSKIKGVQRIYNEIIISSPSSLITRSGDAWITTKVRAQMLTKSGLQSTQIKVITENGAVYLMGHVTPAQAELAVDVARRVAGVQRVVKVFRYRS